MVKKLLDFLNASPVNFLAAKNIANELEQAGYRRLDPQMPIGEVKAGDKFYVTKNVLASSIPVRGVDMGNAILAMHSCRETGSTADHIYCVKAFTKFFA